MRKIDIAQNLDYPYVKDERGTRPGLRDVYTYSETNDAGEALIVELHRGTVHPDWVKYGKVPAGFDHWAVCRVEFTEPGGHAKMGAAKGYDPQMMPGGAGYVNNYEWMLEDTPENRERLLREVERRFYGTPRPRPHTLEALRADGSWIGGGCWPEGWMAEEMESNALRLAEGYGCLSVKVDGAWVEPR